MAVNVSAVLSAYQKTGGVLDEAGAAASAPATGGPSFADALKSFAGDAITSLHKGEAASISAATGKANLADVVTAIDNAEVVLDEVVAIRDKVISAYQTITSSAI